MMIKEYKIKNYSNITKFNKNIGSSFFFLKNKKFYQCSQLEKIIQFNKLKNNNIYIDIYKFTMKFFFVVENVFIYMNLFLFMNNNNNHNHALTKV